MRGGHVAALVFGLSFAGVSAQESKCETVEAPAGYKYLECDPAKIAEAKALLEKHRASQPPAPPPGHQQWRLYT